MVENSKDITRSTMLKYGGGGLGIGIFAGMFSYTYNYYFYNYSSPAYNMGLILGYTFLIFAIWNTFNDPIFGFFSDRTKTRWGRRRPYIIFTVPILIAGLLMIYFPFGTGYDFFFIWILISIFIYDTGYTFVGLNYASLLPELTFDMDNRAKTNSYSIIFQAFGTITAILIGFLFLRNVPMLQIIVLFIAIMGAGALLFTGLTIREKKQFMEVPPLGTKDAILKSFVNKSFLTYEIFNFTYTLMYCIIQIALIQFAISVLELSSFEGTIILGLFSLMTVLGIPLMVYFNRHLGTKKTVFIFMIIFTIGLSFFLVIQSMIQIIIMVIILGLSYSAPFLLNPLIIANIIDEDELKTGRRREGMYFGANALITKPALSVATFLVGLFNTYLFFNPEFNINSAKYIQAATAILGIRLITGVIPALFLIIGLIFLVLFPLNKKRVEKMKTELDELHKKQVA